MISEEERREIEAQLVHYEGKQAACIEALKVMQRHRGWISDKSLEDLSGVLGMTRDELESVATFYNLIFRRPVGRHVILICDSVSCWIMGYERLREHLKAQHGIGFGATTADGRFTLLPTVCLGACDHAPVLMIDGELYQDVEASKLDKVLDQYT
jgi:NADH-quinone oxidoreductase subunit E